jgi:predicted RNA-binding Zn ribbon-like protein
MPEHGPRTPTAFIALESFLWREFAGPEEWRSWLRKHHLSVAMSPAPAAFRRAMMLQKALRSLEAENNGAPGDRASVLLLNQMLREFDLHPVIAASGSAELRSKKNLGPDAPIATLLILVLQAMSQNVWHRFKLCRDPGCNSSFFDSSKSATKTWCSMEKCGSRNKMRCFRATRTKNT